MADRYRPLFKLDAGGMAEVYVAEAESVAGFKKKVALKRILPSLLKEERFLRMFLDEARLSLRLNHANIVTVFDIGKSASTYFIVMEYVEGTNLKFILQYLARRRRPMAVPHAVWLLNEILKGLEYAHGLRDSDTGRELGIVHRDISPPNILVSWNGEVKLTDFGLAKASTQLENTDPGVVKGKFAYLAPEAAEGREVDRRADIFAVGIIGFEMLTGQRLFLGETDYNTVERVRAAHVPNLRALNPEIPPELEAILRRALARNENDRYQRASDFGDDLLGFLFSQGRKVGAREVAAMLQEMRQTEPEVLSAEARAAKPGGDERDENSNLILRLIEDEFETIRSLDESSMHSDPSSKHNLLGGSSADPLYDPSAPLRLDDFDRSNDPTPSPFGTPRYDPTPPPQPHSAPFAIGQGAASGQVDPDDLEAGSKPNLVPWIIALTVVVLGGGGVYLFLGA